MTGPRERFATTKTDRLKKIRRLKAMAGEKKDTGDRRVHGGVSYRQTEGYDLLDDAHAIRWALRWIERHVNLETGELTVALHEPEEAA